MPLRFLHLIALQIILQFYQAQRDGPINPARESEAYAVQTSYLREHGSSTVLVWRRDSEISEMREEPIQRSHLKLSTGFCGQLC